jgi:hypothetical protein
MSNAASRPEFNNISLRRTTKAFKALGVDAIAWSFAGLYLTEPMAGKLG